MRVIADRLQASVIVDPLYRFGCKPDLPIPALPPRLVCPTIAGAISTDRIHHHERRSRPVARQRTAVLICDERNAEPLFLIARGQVRARR
jgi:hypothetical protein